MAALDAQNTSDGDAVPPAWSSPVLKTKNLWAANDGVWLRGLEARYEAWRLRTEATSTIPSVLHQIWLGPRPPPAELERRAAAFAALHPTWTRTLWRDGDVAAFGLANAAAFRAARNWGEKSDIARYEILLRHGGVYADCDFEFLRPLDGLVATCDAFVGFSNVRSPRGNRTI